MNHCFSLARCQTDLCKYGRHAGVPIDTTLYCEQHSKQIIEYIVHVYFGHYVKVGLLITTTSTLFIIFQHKTTGTLSLVAWNAKNLPPVHDKKPLHLRRVINASAVSLPDIVDLLQSLHTFQLFCLLETPLAEIDVVPNVKVPLYGLDVKQLHFDAAYPAFLLDGNSCISPHVLAAPYVMLINGSTTPDPRLHNSGTSSLWTTATGRVTSVLRYGVFVQQIKPGDPFKSLDAGDLRTTPSESKNYTDQFTCEL